MPRRYGWRVERHPRPVIRFAFWLCVFVLAVLAIVLIVQQVKARL